MTRYRVILANSSGGELDSYVSTDLGTAAEELAHLLSNKSWLLAAGDTIRIKTAGAIYDYSAKAV